MLPKLVRFQEGCEFGMQKFRPIEDDQDVAVSFQSHVKSRGHSRKTVQKKLHVC
jgi:hypothetical protein